MLYSVMKALSIHTVNTTRDHCNVIPCSLQFNVYLPLLTFPPSLGGGDITAVELTAVVVLYCGPRWEGSGRLDVTRQPCSWQLNLALA